MIDFDKAAAAHERETDRLRDEQFTDEPEIDPEPVEPEEQPCDHAADKAAREYEDRFHRDPKEQP